MCDWTAENSPDTWDTDQNKVCHKERGTETYKTNFIWANSWEKGTLALCGLRPFQCTCAATQQGQRCGSLSEASSSPKYLYEPRYDKTNNVAVRPAKTQISLGIHPVWSESSLCAQMVAKDPSFLHADSKDSDQTTGAWRFVLRSLLYPQNQRITMSLWNFIPLMSFPN